MRQELALQAQQHSALAAGEQRDLVDPSVFDVQAEQDAAFVRNERRLVEVLIALLQIGG